MVVVAVVLAPFRRYFCACANVRVRLLALPCLALPCLALPCLALPCLALPCLALTCSVAYAFVRFVPAVMRCVCVP